MFESISKLREDKIQKKALDLVEKGVEFVSNGLFKQAMIAFNKSIELAPEYVSLTLREHFYDYEKSGMDEAALSVGLCLIKALPEDYILANKLGNCARRSGNYKQANNLYRHCLKITKAYKEAYYNLAASMGKVDKYDLEVEGVVQPFFSLKNYILPEYAGGQEAIDSIESQIKEEREEYNQIKMQELLLKKELKEAENDPVSVAKVEDEIKRLEAPVIIGSEDILEHLEKKITPKLINIKDFDQLEVEENLFNLTLLALENGRLKEAKKGLRTLKELKSQLKYIGMLRAILLDLTGKTSQGIDLLVKLLGKSKHNRYFNVNIGLMYKKTGNRLLALKYLLIGAVLLERSNGLYHLSELVELAHQQFESGAYKKALKLYRVILMESDDKQVMLNMGEIYIAGGKFDNAAKMYKKVLGNEPENSYANQRLNWIYDYFCNIGEELFAKSIFQTAASKYEHALNIIRKPEALIRAAEIYRILKQQKKANALMDEYNQIKEAEKEREQEKIRQAYIIKGKAFMKEKNYNRAIENFELAFRMKLDKDVFMFLATLYKSLKKALEMESLLKRWNSMVEYEEKMKKYRKEEERKKNLEEEN